MMDKSMSYTKAFSKEVVPANAKHYDPLDAVEDYRVLETQVTLGKEAGSKSERFTIAEKKKRKLQKISSSSTQNKYV